MTQRIEVPGMGIVEFPDSMNDEQIAAAIKKNMAPQTAAPKQQEPVFSATGLPAKAMGAFETGLATVTGSIAPIVGVPAGIIGTLTSGKYGTQEGIKEGEKIAQQVMNKLTYQPTTLKGQEYTEDVAKAFEASKLPPVMAGPTGMVGLGGMGPKGAFRQGANYAVDYTGNAKNQAGNVARGFTGSLGSTENRGIARPGTMEKDIPVYQRPSALEPAGKQYIPDPVLEQMRRQEITPEQALQGMENWTPEQIQALQRTKGMVPYAGQKWQGVGEILSQPYQSLTGGLSNFSTTIGLPALAGYMGSGGSLFGGLLGAGAGIAGKIYNATQTGNKIRSAGQLENVGFTRLSDAERIALEQAQKNLANPQTPPPAAGPVGTPPQTPPPTGGMPTAMPPQTPPQGGAPSMAAPTPAQQAAQATTQAKQQSKWGVSGKYDINSGAGNAKIQTPLGPLDLTFGRNPTPEPTAATAPMPEPQAQPQAQPMPQPQAQPQPQAAAVPEAPTKAQRLAEPHENTQPIAQALEQTIAQDPTLTGFDKSYVIPRDIKLPVENFLVNNTKHAIVYGGPGTGKTSLAGEWLARNPDGNLVYLDPKSFNKAQADALKDASLTQSKVLYVIDEADKFTPTQITHLTNLMDATKGNSKVLATTNDLSKVSKDLKTNEFAQIKVDTKLNPEERTAFALNIAKQFNVNKTPAEIAAIANDPKLKSFRDIKREVSAGYTLKEEPMMSSGSIKGRVDLPENLTTLLDEFNNNQTSKNLIIVDKTAFDTHPQLGDKIDKAGTSLTMDKAEQVLPKTLARSNTASPTYIVDIRSEVDAAKISALKGLIERSNETAYPTKIIIKDRLGHLDPALHSRAEMVDKSYFTKPAVNAKAVNVAKAIQRGEDLGIVKSPKAVKLDLTGMATPEYKTPAEMRRALFGTMPEAEMEARIKKAFPPNKGK